uniref:Uncharacterized protein n=1 Tax=Candidatus Desulfatibia profunda TaxID=2841695 RepID=A0A8J6NWK9_9BACT|nr:hypothetical protein [Candidatus Desulfatibia profunda]
MRHACLEGRKIQAPKYIDFLLLSAMNIICSLMLARDKASSILSTGANLSRISERITRLYNRHIYRRQFKNSPDDNFRSFMIIAEFKIQSIEELILKFRDHYKNNSYSVLDIFLEIILDSISEKRSFNLEDSSWPIELVQLFAKACIARQKQDMQKIIKNVSKTEYNPFIDSGEVLKALCRNFDVDYRQVVMCPAKVWAIIVQTKRGTQRLILDSNNRAYIFTAKDKASKFIKIAKFLSSAPLLTKQKEDKILLTRIEREKLVEKLGENFLKVLVDFA